MNSMPGNDHVAVSKFRTEGVHDWQADEGQTDATCIAAAIDANTEATLALAYEQRTANLIAYAAHLGQTSNHSAMSVLENQVDSRLGLDGDDS